MRTMGGGGGVFVDFVGLVWKDSKGDGTRMGEW